MIELNRIYVLESLPAGDEKTGTQLHNDLLRWQGFKYNGFESVLLEPKTKIEWNRIIGDILADTQNKGFRPIILFEIHGSTKKTG